MRHPAVPAIPASSPHACCSHRRASRGRKRFRQAPALQNCISAPHGPLAAVSGPFKTRRFGVRSARKLYPVARSDLSIARTAHWQVVNIAIAVANHRRDRAGGISTRYLLLNWLAPNGLCHRAGSRHSQPETPRALTCYEWVAVPHYSGNPPVTLLFPRGHWVLTIPGHQQLLLCLGLLPLTEN